LKFQYDKLKIISPVSLTNVLIFMKTAMVWMV
jgi:hypothetical protein